MHCVLTDCEIKEPWSAKQENASAFNSSKIIIQGKCRKCNSGIGAKGDKDRTADRWFLRGAKELSLVDCSLKNESRFQENGQTGERTFWSIMASPNKRAYLFSRTVGRPDLRQPRSSILPCFRQPEVSRPTQEWGERTDPNGQKKAPFPEGKRQFFCANRIRFAQLAGMVYSAVGASAGSSAAGSSVGSLAPSGAW